MRKLLVILIVFLVILSCGSRGSEVDRWEEMFKEGEYEKLLSETAYSESDQAKAFGILALIGLKRFDEIEINSQDGFFKTVSEFLKWRECVFKNWNICNVEFHDDTRFNRALKLLKSYVENLKKLDVEDLRKFLSVAYSRMMDMKDKLKKKLSQSELMKIKSELNSLFDSEISSLDEDDVRKKMYLKLLADVDKRLKLLSIGIDRPQN